MNDEKNNQKSDECTEKKVRIQVSGSTPEECVENLFKAMAAVVADEEEKE